MLAILACFANLNHNLYFSVLLRGFYFCLLQNSYFSLKEVVCFTPLSGGII